MRRLRLEELLDRASAGALTLLSAPSGSGKTALLASWAYSRSVRWWSPTSPDGGSLSEALLAAAHVVRAAAVETGEILDALAGAAATPDILVIDEAEALSDDQLTLLGDAALRAPNAVRLIVSSRTLLPFPIAELELAGTVTELGADRLKFTDAEAHELLDRYASMPAEDAAVVVERAGGWAAALVMDGRAYAAAGDPSAARARIAAPSSGVLEYLRSNIFQALPDETRELLTSIGPRAEFSAADAVVVSDDPTAPAQLMQLALHGCLVTLLTGDGARHGDVLDAARFAAHPLLRDFLAQQTAQGGSLHQTYVLAQARAVDHYLADGDPAQAIQHAILADDRHKLIELVIAHGPTLLISGVGAVLSTAFDRITPPVVEQNPALLAVFALHQRLACAVGSAAGAARVVLQAVDLLVEADLEVSGAESVALRCDAALLRVWMARFGWQDQVMAIRSARAVLGCDVSAGRGTHTHTMGSASPSSSDLPSLARAAWLMGELAATEMTTLDQASAAVHLSEALAMGRALRYPILTSAALAHQAAFAIMHGNFQTAAALGEESLLAAHDTGMTSQPCTARAHLAIAWAHYYDLDFPRATLGLGEAIRMQATVADPLVEVMTLVLSARLAAETGQVDEARRQLASDTAASGPNIPYLNWLLAFTRGQWAIVAGDLSAAAAQAAIMRRDDWLGGGTLFRAILNLYQGKEDVALAALDELLARSDRAVMPVAAAAAAAFRTRILLLRGDRPAAKRALQQALTLAGPQRLTFVLLAGLVAGEAYLDLLREEAEAPDAHWFAAHALRRIAEYADRRPYLERIVSDESATDGARGAAVARPRTRTRNRSGSNTGGASGRPLGSPRRHPGSALGHPPGSTSGPERASGNTDRAGASTRGVRESSVTYIVDGHQPADGTMAGVQALGTALTPRESEVLLRLAEGDSYADIAQALHVSQNTVKTHLSSLYRKLDASRRSEALRRARRMGLI